MDPNTTLSINEVIAVIDKFSGTSLFQGVQTSQQLSAFVEHQWYLVRPEPVLFENVDVLVGGTVKKVQVEGGYYVPFLPMLELLLNCPEVLHCVDNPEPTEKGKFRGPMDGHSFRQNPLVKKFPDTLGICSYDDDANCTDTASSKNKSVKFLYWSLLNLSAELRSSGRGVHLIASADPAVVKSKGHDMFMKDFQDGMNKLSSEEGVEFTISGKKRTFHAVLVHHAGDNPASAACGGFKESAAFAKCPCRQCFATQTELFTSFVEKDFTLRSKELHEAQVAEVEKYGQSGSTGGFNPSVEYGINKRSFLMTINYFDATKCLPQDLMHDVILGTLKQEIACLLGHVLLKNQTNLKKINEKVESVAKYFGVNKPPPITRDHIDQRSIKGSAAETLVLAHSLPFALLDPASGKSACDSKNLNCYILRLNLLDLQMSEEFSLDDVQRLRKIIALHHLHFQRLYPNSLIPKHHYEIHIPTQILLFGPPRFYWCFRFEAKHAYFKRIPRMSHNFINIYFTLSQRHQEKQCGLMMLSASGYTKPYMRKSDRFGSPMDLHLNTCVHNLLLESCFKITGNKSLQRYNFVHIKSVHYSKGSTVILGFERNVPICGEIVDIYGLNGKVAFIYQKLIPEKYVVELNAFKVRYSDSTAAVLFSNILYHHHVPFIRGGGNYILVPCRSYLAHKVGLHKLSWNEKLCCWVTDTSISI
ncbi:hypothetical protein ONE63_011107 [Megalurothrips usitatus]|uniref:Uncharacterized protein n=1 Tax=Megalurothrips usitatus TaxID=439358 RepID=A0AAV7XF14_9NEOP|nr:hypothetical protein ONE63_011107 [Megalurothrips usitatus]